MHMVQQSVSINGRAVVILETGRLYRVETLARQKARLKGHKARLNGAVFHTVRAENCRQAIVFADDPKVPKITGNDMENDDE